MKTAMAVLMVAAGLVLSGNAFAADQAAVQQKKCPVMGAKIDDKVYVDHEGKRVYFCCSSCKDQFKSDPAKYMSKLGK